MTRSPRASALLLAALAACKERTPRPTPDPGSLALPLASASASPSASSSAPAAPEPPDHWSTLRSERETERAANHRPGSAVLAALSVDSDDDEEGELFLERVGPSVNGLWDETAVEGSIDDAGSLSLKDAGTGEVIFRGTLVDGRLAGTLRAEGEERPVHSLPPPPIAQLTQRFELSEPLRTLKISIDHGAIKQVELKIFGAKGKPTPRAEAALQGGRLAVTDERGTFFLDPTARALVGRVPSGRVLFVRPASSSDPPLPLEHEGVRVSSSLLRKGATNTPCDISVELPQVKGTPADAELTRQLQQMAVNAAAGLWPSGEAPPTVASFSCKRDETSDMVLKSASFQAVGLPGGFINLEVSGYSRTSSMGGGVTVIDDCALLDGKRGELIKSALDTLPDDAREAIRRHADRSLKRQNRTAKLTRDDFFVADDLSSLNLTSLCLGKGDPALILPLGVITKSMPTAPFRIPIPRRVVLRHLPQDHRLRPLFLP